MDENTRFLIERMDLLEARIMKKIDDLQAFKNRIVGMALIFGGIGSMIVQAALKLM